MRQSNLRQVIITVMFISLVSLVLWVQSPYFGRAVYPWHYRDEIVSTAEKYGVDPFLVAAIANAESKFNPNARSPKGAIGLMQLMPETAVWIAEQLKWTSFSLDQLTDPQISLELGCWYLDNLTEEFGDQLHAIAAYNAGRGNLKKWLAQDVWDGRLETADQIPFRETREYVRKVSKQQGYYRNLYGSTKIWPWWK